MRGSRITVGLVMGRALMKDAMASLLRDQDLDLAFVCTSGSDALTLARQTDPDVVCAHVSLPERSGLSLAGGLRKMAPRVRCLLLADHDRADIVEKVIQAGADGFASVGTDGEGLRHAIAELAAGRQCVLSTIPASVVQQYRLAPPGQQAQTSLTRRQRQVLELICEGLTETQIAERLGIARNTAHVHKNNLMRSLQVHSKVQLVKYAMQEHLVPV